MKVEMRALDSIKPYEKNAKKHDQTQIDNVAESIRQYGFVQPIVVDRDGVIVIGHCRALGAGHCKEYQSLAEKGWYVWRGQERKLTKRNLKSYVACNVRKKRFAAGLEFVLIRWSLGARELMR